MLKHYISHNWQQVNVISYYHVNTVLLPLHYYLYVADVLQPTPASTSAEYRQVLVPDFVTQTLIVQE